MDLFFRVDSYCNVFRKVLLTMTPKEILDRMNPFIDAIVKAQKDVIDERKLIENEILEPVKGKKVRIVKGARNGIEGRIISVWIDVVYQVYYRIAFDNFNSLETIDCFEFVLED